MVDDFAPGNTPVAQYLSGFAQIGTRAVFLRFDDEGNPSLWVTDGTEEGTKAVGVLCPPCSGAELLGSTGSVAFYQASSAYPNPEMRIWRTDGTAAGTYPLMVALSAGGPASLQGGRLFFSACTKELGCEIWSSDGSAIGTAPVGEIAPGPENAGIRQIAAFGDQAYVIAGVGGGPTSLWLAGPSSLKRLRETPRAGSLTLAGGRVFFVAQDDGLEIWTSNGTPAGTRPLTHFEPRNPFKYGALMKVIEDRLYFTAVHRGSGVELWSVGARPEGLLRLTAFGDRWGYFTNVIKVGQRIVFAARARTDRVELWTSQGDFRSTKPLAGCRGGCPSVESDLVSVGSGQLVFFGRNGAGEGIWRTDGTAAGTWLLKRTGPYHELSLAVAVGGRALIEITNEYELGELWISDGTAAGTFFVVNGGPEWSHYFGWVGRLLASTANGQLLFPALSEEGYEVLWRSDGSPAGSSPLTDPWIAQSSFPRRLTPFGDRLLSEVCTASTGTEWQLRAVRGSDSEILLSRPLAPYPLGYCETFVMPIVTLAQRAVFVMNDGQGGVSLWGTDGTAVGTAVLFPAGSNSFPLSVVRFGDQAAVWVFVIDESGQESFGSQLWLTDGTPAGTHKLMDLPAATETAGLTSARGKLYFSDVEFQGSRVFFRPWVSDGTLAGTFPLTENASSTAPFFTENGDQVFFPFTPPGGQLEIWSSDGTPAGTGPAITAASGMSHPESLIAAQGRLYFAARRLADPSMRLFPWVSDGTDGGTATLGDSSLVTNSFALPFAPQDHPMFTELDGRVYFAATDSAHGEELWSTDGTPEGTALVRDAILGPLGSYPRNLEAWRGRLYFVANDRLHGRELWTSDGSPEGTKLVQDIHPGPPWSAPADLTATDGSLYFSGNDGVHGRELWELPANQLND